MRFFPDYRKSDSAKYTVVSLIIVHKKDPLENEIASLLQYKKVLGHYPTYLICPEGLDVSAYGSYYNELEIDYIPPIWQSSYGKFNRLKIEPFLYNRYKIYKYILFYELDAWVFRDELLDWCDKGFDYIGAPWFKGREEEVELKQAFTGVGNGGFSLRKVSSMIKVLTTFRLILSFDECNEFLDKQTGITHIKKYISLLKSFTISNNSHHWFNNFGNNEDHFWGKYVPKRFPWYRTPPMKEALQFSFEKRCEESYELLGQQLPFGCHKWWNPDVKDFWGKFIAFPTKNI